MSDELGDRVYEIEVTYQDSGMSLNMAMEEWRPRIEEDFSSFEAIQEFYRRDLEEIAESLTEHGREVEPDEEREGPGIVITNAPKEWKEDFAEAAPFLQLIEEQMVRMALFSLVEEELEEERRLWESEQYKPLIIRQSAFFESYLVLQCQLAFQQQKGESLSNNEMNMIEGMGHTDRIRLANLLGEIDEEDHGHLQSMASLRNKLAHSPWNGFDSDEEANIKSTARNVLNILESGIGAAYEAIERDEFGPSDDDFDIGFSGLDSETQLLQLGILDVMDANGGITALDHVETVVPGNPEDIRQRCLRMDHIGYLSLDMESKTVEILQKGEELLEAEFPPRE